MDKDLVATLVPLFALIAIGFGWERLRRPYDTQLISNLVMTIGAPCLVFSTLSKLQLKPATLLTMGAATALCLTLLTTAGLVTVGVARLPMRTYLPPLIFGNVGNLGLALCFFAFGKEGLALAIVYYAISSALLFTLGSWLWSGSTRPQLFFQIPVIYAVFLSIPVILFHWSVPLWLSRPITLIGQITIPLMLVTLGVSLAKLKIQRVKRVATFSVLRLALGFGAGVAAAQILDLQGAARDVTVLESTMPVAVFNYVFAARYEREPEEIAGVVVVSTLLSLLALPALLHYV